MNQETINKVMAELGRRGGKKSSKKKTDAAKKSLAKARKAKAKKKQSSLPGAEEGQGESRENGWHI